MNRHPLRTIALLLFLAAGCRSGSSPADHHDHGHEPAAAADVEKGPHGGRLLRDHDFAVEVTIFERGLPPEYRVYASSRGEPIDPAEVALTITLRRFGGRVDTIGFTKRDDYLLGNATVDEPHSFDVEVAAEHRGRPARWAYQSYEGRTEMSPDAIAKAGVEIETVGPAAIRTVLHATGRISPNTDRLAHIVPRYAGLVKAVRAGLGDTVTPGQALAVVENNDSLQPYDVKTAIGGIVIAKHVTVGELAREGDVLFTVADLGTVWADLAVPSAAARQVRVGTSVTIADARDGETAEGRITYVAPIGTAQTQSRLVRAELSNDAGQWTPGLFVTGDILVGSTTLPAAVKTSALQRFRDWDVVFLHEGNVFQAMPVELGRRDSEWAEVLEGVGAGRRYVTGNSFLVKADIEKSRASHDH